MARRAQKAEADQRANAVIQRDKAIAAERQTAIERDKAIASETKAREEAAKAQTINDFLTQDLLTQAPSPVDEKQLRELHIRLRNPIAAA